jgi:hypothetical protein
MKVIKLRFVLLSTLMFLCIIANGQVGKYSKLLIGGNPATQVGGNYMIIGGSKSGTAIFDGKVYASNIFLGGDKGTTLSERSIYVGGESGTKIYGSTIFVGGESGTRIGNNTLFIGGEYGVSILGDKILARNIDAGKIIADKIVLNVGSFPDYVFSDEYKLMPLNKVKSFILNNRHLPNMPSEAEVIDNGMSVGELNVKLVEKIEELTLYILEQEDRINDLAEELKALKTQ